MKICDRCSGQAHLTVSICASCGRILEQATHIRIMWVGFPVTAVLTALLRLPGKSEYGYGDELAMNWMIFASLGTVGWKLLQKIQMPERNFFRELAALYSDRERRIGFLCAAFFIPLIPTGIFGEPFRIKPSPFSFDSLAHFRYSVICSTLLFYFIVAIVQMKLGLFNLKIANPLATHKDQ